MSTRALMMIVKQDDISGFTFDSPQNIWKRLRSESRGVILFRHFDGDPETVKRDVDKSLDFAERTKFNSGFNAEDVSSCLIAATMKVFPVQAAWRPLQEIDIDQTSPVFHYLLILDLVHQEWHFYWWKLEENEFGQRSWAFQTDPGILTGVGFTDDLYDVVEKHFFGNRH